MVKRIDPESTEWVLQSKLHNHPVFRRIPVMQCIAVFDEQVRLLNQGYAVQFSEDTGYCLDRPF